MTRLAKRQVAVAVGDGRFRDGRVPAAMLP